MGLKGKGEMDGSARTRQGCFLIGCGPSLNQVDVRKLADYDTITFNRSFIAWHRWLFDPTYFACFDPVVLSDNLPEIRQLLAESKVRRFFLVEDAASEELRSERITRVCLSEDNRFSTDIDTMSDFGNVGASSLQILAHMGYERVVMVGVDADYGRLLHSDTENEVFTRDGEDLDHFDPLYSKGKLRVVNPDLQKRLGQWPLVAEGCRHHGMDVRNASPGSSLKCFEEIEFREALSWISDPAASR